MSVIDSVKHAPRWAWITAGGVGIGAAAVKLYRDRAVDPGAEAVSGEVVDGNGNPVGTAPAPSGGYPGVVVPPVVIGNQTPDENQGTGVLQNLYVGAIQDVVSGWSGLVTQLVGQQSEQQNKMWDFMTGQQGIIGGSLQNQSALIAQLATAGGAPGQVVNNPSPVVSAPIVAPPPPAPAPPPAAPAYRVEIENRTRDNGLAGTKRRAWCNRVTIHRYPNGTGVVVAEDKIHDGAC